MQTTKVKKINVKVKTQIVKTLGNCLSNTQEEKNYICNYYDVAEIGRNTIQYYIEKIV